MMKFKQLFRLLAEALGLRAHPASAGDCRGGRFVAVIECVLNQNVRDAGAARFPAMNFALLQLCHAHDVGVLLLTCPEVAVLGARRARPRGQSLRAALDSSEGRCRCRALAETAGETIAARLAQGSRLLAIVGGNPQSPGCAVHHGAAGLSTDSGVFMQVLQVELRRRGIDAPFMALRDAKADALQADLTALAQTFASQCGPTARHASLPGRP